jgi:hypothetical protein
MIWEIMLSILFGVSLLLTLATLRHLKELRIEAENARQRIEMLRAQFGKTRRGALTIGWPRAEIIRRELVAEEERLRQAEKEQSRYQVLIRFLATEAPARKKSALRILNAWGAILPIRLATEDLGDYREDIENRANRGERWLLLLRVLTAILWTGINTVGFISKNLLGKATQSHRKKSPK